MGRCILGGILAGIVIFIWGFISWMVLPWHSNSFHAFNDEKAVTEIITSNAAQSGMYMAPMQHADASTTTAQPMVFTAVYLEATPASMTMQLLISLLTQIVAAFFVAWLLTKTVGLSYWGRVGFVVIFAIAAGILVTVPYWNWFHFDPRFSMFEFFDIVVGWFLAGLVLARFCRA